MCATCTVKSLVGCCALRHAAVWQLDRVGTEKKIQSCAKNCKCSAWAASYLCGIIYFYTFKNLLIIFYAQCLEEVGAV
uniref:Uncharacterized protein n=1 Tax=Physcomitrium patens TaxID=3218 RepID=A0A2K1JH33_PHYPA|nr:hypothetical protein PHYPA_018266 [Physcomitrium patens]